VAWAPIDPALPGRMLLAVDRSISSANAPECRVFISYRREDSADATYRLADALIECFGQGNLFVDIDSIPAGEDFAGVLSRAVAFLSCPRGGHSRRWPSDTFGWCVSAVGVRVYHRGCGAPHRGRDPRRWPFTSISDRARKPTRTP
jgi:hypothetical protein